MILRKFDYLFFAFRKFLIKNKNTIRTGLLGYIGAQLLSIKLKDISAKSLISILESLYHQLFAPDSLVNIVNWLVISGFILFYLTLFILNIFYKNNRIEVKFASLFSDKVDPLLVQYAKSPISWGSAITLQKSPEVIGWSFHEIHINEVDDTIFSLPKDLKSEYNNYLQENYERERFFDDGIKYMLKENPVAFSDSKTLKLSIQKTKYSYIKYIGHLVEKYPDKKEEFLKDSLIGDCSIRFPHSLSLHSIIVTSDGKIVMTRRSSQVSYFPEHWSFSAEEQLSIEDLKFQNPLLECAKRLLLEEFGLSEDDYSTENFRLLSVFLEGNILNCSLCALLKLDISSQELNHILSAIPRTDYEFSDWKFIEWNKLPGMLKNNTFKKHPTSDYRILLAILSKYGFKDAIHRIFTD